MRPAAAVLLDLTVRPPPVPGLTLLSTKIIKKNMLPHILGGGCCSREREKMDVRAPTLHQWSGVGGDVGGSSHIGQQEELHRGGSSSSLRDLMQQDDGAIRGCASVWPYSHVLR